MTQATEEELTTRVDHGGGPQLPARDPGSERHRVCTGNLATWHRVREQRIFELVDESGTIIAFCLAPTQRSSSCTACRSDSRGTRPCSGDGLGAVTATGVCVCHFPLHYGYQYDNNCLFLIRAVGDDDVEEEEFMDTVVGGPNPSPSQRKGARRKRKE